MSRPALPTIDAQIAEVTALLENQERHLISVVSRRPDLGDWANRKLNALRAARETLMKVRDYNLAL